MTQPNEAFIRALEARLINVPPKDMDIRLQIEAHNKAINEAISLAKTMLVDGTEQQLREALEALLFGTGAVIIQEGPHKGQMLSQTPAAKKAKAALALPAGQPDGMVEAYNWPKGCNWPEKPFTFHNEPGEHDPCYVIMPCGSMLPLNHYNDAETDITRAEFIVAACNYYIRPYLRTQPIKADLQKCALAIWLDNGGIESVFLGITANEEHHRDGPVQKARCISNAKAVISTIPGVQVDE